MTDKRSLTGLNQAWFDHRAALHAQSEFYNVGSVIDGEIRLSDFEIEEIGDVTDKDLAQLQCHIGLEAVSFARLGAKVVGLDFSEQSIVQAREIARKSGVSVDYVVSDVYEADQALGPQSQDVVYVNGGSLHWLPDIERWGKTMSRLLRPGGMLYLSLFHPISQRLADDSPTFVGDYFDTDVQKWDEPGSYVDPNAVTEHNEHVVWEHTVSDIMMSVIEADMEVTLFRERPGQDFQQFPYQIKGPDGKWHSPPGTGSYPSTFSLRAIRKASQGMQ